jgi:hypothetical protein
VRKSFVLVIVVVAVAAVAATGARSGSSKGRGGDGGRSMLTTLPAYNRPPVTAGTPGSPHQVLYLFALTFGTVSSATAARRDLTLASLAAPALAATLRPAARSAQQQAARGLLPGERIGATVESLEFGAATTVEQHGSVVLEQRMIRANGTAESTVDTAFLAVLTHTSAGWRVSRFTAVP